MKRVRNVSFVITGLLIAATSCIGQQIDPGIARQINSIWAIDNHAHPVLAPPLDNTDRNFDALPATDLPPESDPVALRPDFPLLGAAWKALYGFNTPPPLDANGMRQLDAVRERVKQRQGKDYPAWVLDKAKIGTMLANRVAMGRGVEPPRFRWVPYVDALLFPLDNSGMAAVSPDRKQFFALEDRVRARYLKKAGMSTPPRTLDEYLKQVVLPTLERQKAGGAVAEKFEVAYLRSFNFSNPPHAKAESIYAEWIGRGTPDAAEYKSLQDFLFRYIAAECGRLGLPVHLHAMAGAGSYFSIAGVNPLLLEPLFNDPKLRKTNFVLLHGGWPYVREIGALLQKPNVYLDISSQDLIITPRTEAKWLREWLEFEPQKVLFGTDGYPYTNYLGWPEATWIASRDARQALGIALTGMVQDNEITRQRAYDIARMVLRGNAEALYKFTASDGQPASSAASIQPSGNGPLPSGRGAYLLPRGYFTTRGAQIVDQRGVPVRIASVAWYGFETKSLVVTGLKFVNYKKTMRAMKADGFNTMRLPWCDLLLTHSPAPGTINYSLNPGLKGLTSIQIADKIIDYAGVLGLRVILDHHTDDGGGGQQPNGLWFDKGPGTDGTDGAGNIGTVTAAKFQADTLALASRYKENPTVIGFDLDNEPLSRGADGASLNWGKGGPTDIWWMYTTVGNALLRMNPHWLIICEGPQTPRNSGNGLAGVGPEADLSAVGGIDGVPAKPVDLIEKHQVVYSVHEYGTAIYDFKANEHPASLIAHMNRDWGYLYTKNIAPVWIGELGSSLLTPEERTWAQALMDYMNGKDGAQGGPVFTGNEQPVSGSWWAWGYFPGEQPDGTLESDWLTPKPDQQAITDQLLYRPKGE